MALDYPNSPTLGQVFQKWTWSGSAWVLTAAPATLVGTVTWYQEGTPPTSGTSGETWYQPSTNTLFVLEAGVWTPVTSPSTGGFTFVSDTAPTPTKAGDNWFDTSTGASGGTSWVAVSEVPGSAGPLNWVQFAPGSATSLKVPQSGQAVGGNGAIAAGAAIASVGIPAAGYARRALGMYHCLVNGFTPNSDFQLRINGGVFLQLRIPGANDQIDVSAPIDLAANTAYTFSATATATANVYADPTFHLISWIAWP